jgi:hypothetical protein
MIRKTFLLATLSMALQTFAADAGTSKLSFANAAPREVEDTTQQAVARDYSAAWKSLSQALEQNRADLLNANFVGVAREKFGQAIADQQKNGLRRRYIDRGHNAQVIFYSVDGSSMQIRDAAQFEIQLLDGDKVVSSETATINYIALLTPAENSWRVRVLEAVLQ